MSTAAGAGSRAREVADRSSGPRTVWLASYPKSGNTWVRAIVTALSTDPRLFGVNRLSSGSQPYVVDSAMTRYGIDPRWLSRTEIAVLRAELIRETDRCHVDALDVDDEEQDRPIGGPPDGGGIVPSAALPLLRKTHECFRFETTGVEPFPADASRAAILIVRDPRDVACSYAPFFGLDLDQAVDALGRRVGGEVASPATLRTAQPWATWSEHARSWLDPQVPFPVHLVRYEDLRTDAVATLLPVFNAVGLDCDTATLAAAVERARFERLQEAESRERFRESSPKTRSFFRQGRAGGWRSELSVDQVAAIEADQGEMMERLGYEMTTGEAARRSLAEARASRRRQRGRAWYELPEHLGLDVRAGVVPEVLADAVRPKPWIQINERAALVRLGSGAAVLVEDGCRVTVHWDADESETDVLDAQSGPTAARPTDEDRSWVVQGWAVVLATMQRGQLCLHASTVEVGSDVVAIAGRRGAGKSTTSMGLRARGHRLLVDDSSVLELRPDGAWLLPYSRNVHLLPDAAEALGVDFEALAPLAGRAVKSSFLAEETSVEPRRIERIVVLQPTAAVTEPTVVEVHGLTRVQALRNHLVRDGVAPLVMGNDRFFAQLTQLADVTRVQLLQRPMEGWTLDEVLDVIERSG